MTTVSEILEKMGFGKCGGKLQQSIDDIDDLVSPPQLYEALSKEDKIRYRIVQAAFEMRETGVDGDEDDDLPAYRVIPLIYYIAFEFAETYELYLKNDTMCQLTSDEREHLTRKMVEEILSAFVDHVGNRIYFPDKVLVAKTESE